MRNNRPACGWDIHVCVLYCRELSFHLDGSVDLTYRVLDNWRPFDDEAESLASQFCRGILVENSRDYIEIRFPVAWGSQVQNGTISLDT